MQIKLIESPTFEDWMKVKQRALVTMYEKNPEMLLAMSFQEPKSGWKHDILEARHSPIRYLRYSFFFKDIPSNLATHLARHVHAQPYISSLRNDRQDTMDGDEAPRNTPVNMILDVDAEEMMIIANKRLCNKAAKKTRDIVAEMCKLVVQDTPEMKDLLVPMCMYCGGVCHEMHSCGLVGHKKG